MENVDDMESKWSSEIIKCLDFIAPMKTRKVKQKKYNLPKEIQSEIQKRKILHKRYKSNLQHSVTDPEIEREFKKQSKYCNKLLKNVLREKRGQGITKSNNMKETWKSINHILHPERISKCSLKIETEGQVFQDPLEIAEKFNTFFREKV